MVHSCMNFPWGSTYIIMYILTYACHIIFMHVQAALHNYIHYMVQLRMAFLIKMHIWYTVYTGCGTPAIVNIIILVGSLCNVVN
jgi:hypothetical protein